MITKYKIFEKLGVDKLVSDISERIWKNFLKVYDKNKVFTDTKDTFQTDISEFKLGSHDKLGVNINYNIALSQGGITMNIGAVDRNNNSKAKSNIQLKRDISHEVQHLIYAMRKYGYIKDVKKFKNTGKEFFHGYNVIFDDIFNAFRDPTGNIYDEKVSIQNFYKYNKFSDTYKNLVVFLYLAEDNELTSRIQEFYVKSRNSDDYLKDMKEDNNYKEYKRMINYKIDIESLNKYELNKIAELFETNTIIKKSIKKVQKYINMKGNKFIKKVHKLSYFHDSDTEL